MRGAVPTGSCSSCGRQGVLLHGMLGVEVRCSTGTQGRQNVVCLLETALSTDPFPWFCAGRVVISLVGVPDAGNKGMDEIGGAGVRHGCYGRQWKEASTPEVADLLGLSGRRSPGYGGRRTGAARRPRSARLRVCGLGLGGLRQTELDRLQGWWLLHSFHTSPVLFR